jgi:hypothetical protein
MSAHTLIQPEACGRARAAPASWSVRVPSAILFLLGSCVLVLSACLTPSSTGLGTHEQLGLPKCGFLLATGLPCPTCGYTTAFALAAHGRLGAALCTQPAGFVLALAVTALTLVGAYTLVAGVSLGRLARLLRPGVFLALGVLILGAWVYKILIVCHSL